MAKEMDIRDRDKALLEILHHRVQNSGMLSCSICCSPSGCLPSRVAVNAQGYAIGEYMFQPFRLFWKSLYIAKGVAFGQYLSQHSVLPASATSFDRPQSLLGFDRKSLRHCRGEGLASVPAWSLKGSDKYFLRHRRGGGLASVPAWSLKGSDKYFLRHRRGEGLASVPAWSLKGSDKYFLRHRRRIILDHLQSVSLKGSDRYSPMAKPWDSFTPKFQ